MRAESRRDASIPFWVKQGDLQVKSIRSLRAHVAAVLALGLCVAGSASALTIDVTGVAGSGTSVLTFSGTSSAGSLPGSAQVDGFFVVANGQQFTNLNSWFGGFSGGFGTNVTLGLGSGATVTGSSSGIHALDGFRLTTNPSLVWFADGAFPGNETLTFSGSASSPFEITSITGISGLGDETTVTATNALGDLTVNFSAVPEPSTVLLLGGGLLGLAARGRRSNA